MEHAKPKPFVIADDLVLSSIRQADALYRGSRARGDREAEGADNDAVLTKLRQAEELYQQFQARWEGQIGALAEARGQLVTAQETNDQLAHALAAARRQLEQERAKAARERERAQVVSALLKDIHRSLFGGNVYDLILRACLTITGATRGLYVTARERGEDPRVRAAIEVDGYPQAPPSGFIGALCRRVVKTQDTLAWTEGERPDLPQPAKAGEQFRNYLAAPVVLLNNPSGVIIVADKLHGDFEEDDTETLLNVGERASGALEDVERQRALEAAYVATFGALAGAMETKDPYARGQGALAARYARQVAARLDLPEPERRVACYAALLRDVGKVGVSDGTLHKPGPLLPTEHELVRAHARMGHDLLCTVPALQEIAAVVLHHHERYDGGGYPDGLRGEAIPLAARIVGAVDAYCGMLARRGHRAALGGEQARAELARGAGRQFDPRVVEALLVVLDQPPAGDEAEDEEAEALCGILPGFDPAPEARRAAQ